MKVDHVRIADGRWVPQAAQGAGLKDGERSLPHANGEHADGGSGEPIGVRIHVVEPVRMGRHSALAPDEFAIPVDLVCVVDARDEDLVFAGRPGSGLDIDVSAIPRKPGIGRVCFRAPCIPLVGRASDLLPPAVIVVRPGVLGIVAKDKPPVAVDVDDAFAKTPYDEGAI